LRNEGLEFAAKLNIPVRNDHLFVNYESHLFERFLLRAELYLRQPSHKFPQTADIYILYYFSSNKNAVEYIFSFTTSQKLYLQIKSKMRRESLLLVNIDIHPEFAITN
jgi:hypothetical protein